MLEVLEARDRRSDVKDGVATARAEPDVEGRIREFDEIRTDLRVAVDV